MNFGKCVYGLCANGFARWAAKTYFHIKRVLAMHYSVSVMPIGLVVVLFCAKVARLGIRRRRWYRSSTTIRDCDGSVRLRGRATPRLPGRYSLSGWQEMC